MVKQQRAKRKPRRRKRSETLGGSPGGGARAVWRVLFPNLFDEHLSVAALALRAALSVFMKHPYQCRFHMEIFFNHMFHRIMRIGEVDNEGENSNDTDLEDPKQP